MSLKKYEKNIQSQFGEDGIIEEIFKRIGTVNKICVEFGAWDGIFLSNAWTLWHDQGWKAILIEGDPEKFTVLVENTKDHINVNPHLAYVASKGDNSLENILSRLRTPHDLDLLSIDIDGDDYYILESLTTYKPRLVIVEYNPTVPPNVELKQEEGEYFGSSALSILNLAHRKNYKLVHMTDTNMFLVNNDDFPKMKMEEPALKDVFVYDHLVNVISSYDGKTMLVGNSPYSNFQDQHSKIKFPSLISNETSIVNITVRRAKLLGLKERAKRSKLYHWYRRLNN